MKLKAYASLPSSVLMLCESTEIPPTHTHTQTTDERSRIRSSPLKSLIVITSFKSKNNIMMNVATFITDYKFGRFPVWVYPVVCCKQYDIVQMLYTVFRLAG